MNNAARNILDTCHVHVTDYGVLASRKREKEEEFSASISHPEVYKVRNNIMREEEKEREKKKNIRALSDIRRGARILHLSTCVTGDY